jgi:hypothetical protein
MPAPGPINAMIQTAEANLISTTPGAVPPHLDDGGHLPFGGTIGDTRGPSAFGKRKMTRANAIGNPQALLLNYPPENTDATLKCWERNCVFCAPAPSPLRTRADARSAARARADKSSIYEDPSAEAERLFSSNYISFGMPDQPSYLASANQTWGNLRRTACTRPTPSPHFYPPPRDATAEQVEAAKYTWSWPEREKRAAAPQIKRPEKIAQSFLEEYEIRPPWLKY